MAETELAPAAAVEQNKQGLIGKAVDRIDGPMKVTGCATYSHEYARKGEALYGFIVPATIAKGRITAIDHKAAAATAGVVAVLTHENAPKQAPPHPRVSENRFDREEPFLFAPEVRYYGEPVALVIADSFETARHAAHLVKVTYRADKSAQFDLKANKDKGYKPKVVNAGMPTDTKEGDFDGAFAAAEVKIDAEYVVPHEHNMPMEPHATIAEWDGERLIVYSGQQIPATAVSTLAKTLLIPKENVRVITTFIGGGFGAKVPVHAQAILAALGAKAVGRPVKVAQTRQQMFANTNHRPAGIQRMRLGAQKDGTLTAIAHDVWMQTTPFDEFVEQAAAFSRTLYAAPNRLHRHWGVTLDLPASDIMRAPGEEPGSVAMECGMDELAVALGMDPIELRLKNEPKDDPETHLPFSSRSLVQCLQEGAKTFGWDQRPKTPGEKMDGKWRIGYGVACAAFPTFMRPSRASVQITPDGIAVARMSATDIGTGTFTILAQLLAEETGLPMDRVRVEIGDSALPPAAGSGGSFGAASAGTALHLACEKLREEIAKAIAIDERSPLFGVAADQIVLADGQIKAGEKAEELTSFLKRSKPQGMSVEAGHEGSPMRPKYSMHVYGAQFVEVGVDVDTCEVRLRRMLGVFASGRILNEKTAKSQITGAMIMGAGAALTEESVVDLRDGSFVNHDLAEYHVPVNADIPTIEAMFIPEKEDKANPLGIKGLGEVGIVGVAAAVSNAVFNATGVRVREFPVTLDKVLMA